MEKSALVVWESEAIRAKIITVRGLQVMMDSDLAEIYGVEARRLNEQVKRNKARFPIKFRFQLTSDEYEEILRSQIATSSSGNDSGREESLRSQFVTLNKEGNVGAQENVKSQIVTSSLGNASKGKESLRSQIATLNKSGRGQHKKYLPYVFTEQGIAMLSAVLRSQTAVEVSIKIMDAFVGMRHLLRDNSLLSLQLGQLAGRQFAFEKETKHNFEKIFGALEAGQATPKQGVFFDGQVFDAYQFCSDLIRSAKKSIILIDNYVDDSVLTMLLKRRKGVSAQIYTKSISRQLLLDLQKHNQQYPAIEIKTLASAHDRFLILDDELIYHLGASLKDLGEKWFAFSKIDLEAVTMLARLNAATHG